MRIILLLFTLVTLSSCYSTGLEEDRNNNDNVVRSQRTLTQATKDFKISAAIHTDLASLDLYKPIDVNVVNGNVILTGSVTSSRDRLAATGIAWNQVGVRSVINELVVDHKKHNNFSTKQYAKDTLITTTVKAKTIKDSGVKASNYTIVTTNNIVYIFGVARSLEEANKIESLAREVDGVKNVVSHVHIREVN